MRIEFHVSKKVINDDETTVVSFDLILNNGGEGSSLTGRNVTLTIPSVNDTFEVGDNYDSNFVLIP